MNILSLFDGTSAGRLAAERAGLPINKYYASEIDKYAIAVSKKNYPDIIHGVLIEGYIRKLTPIECERLQTLPDNYTQGEINGKEISDNQRYKMLGNGWTVDIIAHILKHIGKEDGA